ncbi:MAG: tetratricopeptide repeat protein [Nitrospinaceae bacterium]|nr:tetratricopeptide repeat protein [Nitrospinaceae bacterium]
MSNLQQALALAVQHQNAGRLSEAERICEEILQGEPNQPEALHMLGAIAIQVERYDMAVDLIPRALAIKPDVAAAHYNMGYALGALGRLDEAVTSYKAAVAIAPNYAEAHNNLGILLQDLGNPEQAIESYGKALAIKPDSAETYCNLGNAYKIIWRQDEAVAHYQKALAIRPDFVEALGNLGGALTGLGRLQEAVACCHKALGIKPDSKQTWLYLAIAIKALRFSQAREKRKAVSDRDGLGAAALAASDFAMFEYHLAGFKPHAAGESLRRAMAALPALSGEAVGVIAIEQKPEKPPQLAEKVVALFHFGRSGTGLLHSLIDGHPEISTLPSIYLRGFFNDGVWEKISAAGWRALPARFADEFAVLFDANSAKTTPGFPGEDSLLLGKKEGMANVGENRNESLLLDRERFCFEATQLMAQFEKIDQKLFFRIIHAVFEKLLGTKTRKDTIFYHIHNPVDSTKLNFIRHAPEARIIMMVREPIQCCESWVRISFNENNYSNVVQKIITMLFAVDQIMFRMQDSVGIRLEDLKTQPQKTLRALCGWLGVEEAPSLYEMTAQGKKWWGDPTSPDYDGQKPPSPFEMSSINRATGAVFGDKDQLVLGTLFYPFSQRFGYREPEPQQLQKNLKEIRPLLDDMLGFEKAIAERLNIDCRQFKQNGFYQFFRAALVDRWDALNEFGDYPNMLKPLPIA